MFDINHFNFLTLDKKACDFFYLYSILQNTMRLLLLIIICHAFANGQTTISNNTRADINFIRQSIKTNEQITTEIRDNYPIYTINGKDYVSFLIEKSANYKKADLINQGVIIGAEIKDIVSIKYPLLGLGNILDEPQFKTVHLAGKIKPMLSKVPYATRADSVWMGYNLPQSYSGKDVLIGITDWGFDYTSPMFYDTLLQNTRILAAWDQYKTSGPAPSYGYGTEYNTPSDLIAAGSDTSNIYSFSTHGSHVAGIAGGSGAGTQYRGIGFESNFLFTTFLVDEGSVLDAWDWMYNKSVAEDKRLIINMSWGLYHMDAIDGSALISQALNDYSDLGVVFVTSAGNNGDVNFHIKKDFNDDTLRTKVNFYTNASLATLYGQSLHMWGESGNSFSSQVQVLDNANNIVGESQFYSTLNTNYVDTFLIANIDDTVWFNLSADNSYPTNGRPQMRLRIKRTSLKVALVSEATSGTVHYWNVTELTSDVGNWGMPLTSVGSGFTAGDNQYGIGTPACSEKAISVAAYTPEYLALPTLEVNGMEAIFSSIGPLITEEMKPDITAPGVSITSSISSFTDASYTQVTSVSFNGRTYPFAKFSGTSMSSPATAGVIALVLEANPYLSAQQVKDILIQTARLDNYTGMITNPGDTKWGWGKVNAYDAVKLAVNTTGTNDFGKTIKWQISPNPSSDVISLNGDLSGIEAIQIINLKGEIMNTTESCVNIPIHFLESGAYFIRIIRDGKIEQSKFIKL